MKFDKTGNKISRESCQKDMAIDAFRPLRRMGGELGNYVNAARVHALSEWIAVRLVGEGASGRTGLDQAIEAAAKVVSGQVRQLPPGEKRSGTASTSRSGGGDVPAL